MRLNMERFERYERVMKWAFFGLCAVCAVALAVRGCLFVVEMTCRCNCN